PAEPYGNFAAQEILAHSPPLGDSIAAMEGYSRIFDRTQFVLTVWYPFEPGDHGAPAVWPSSPPLPGPYPGDGVCEVSRGEDSNMTTDCPVHCGDAVCQASEGESTQNCPGDCRL